MSLEEIRKAEAEARKLETTTRRRQDWNQQVAAYADEFIATIEDRKAYDKPQTDGSALTELDFPEQGRKLESLLPLLRREVDGVGINPASGGHLGYIPGGGVFPTALGDYLAAVTNRYAGIFFGNPGAVRMENQLLRWMCRLVGYPEGSLGNLASGGSIANLIAITTARDDKGITPEKVGRSVIYLSEQVHHCVQKALRIAGLGTAHIRYIPLDKRFRLRADALADQVKEDRENDLIPFLVVGSAGTTDTGAIDPLEAMADIARDNDLWFHVDAAYGGFFLLVDECKEKFRGIERSDSLAIDPHKGMFLSYGVGAVLMKDVEAQMRSHYYRANYMQDAFVEDQDLSPADLSPELTKHFRGLRMWLPMQLFGLAPFRAALKEKLLLCNYFYREIQKLGFEVGPQPELSVMIYRYLPKQDDPDKFNARLVDYVQKDGRIFLSSTSIDGTYWLRLAVLSFRTHLREIEICLQVLKEGVEELEGTG